MRRFQTKSGGQVLKPASTDMVDHVRFAVSTARQGTRCWIKSKDPDDDMSKYYSAEFRTVDGALQVTFFEWQYVINPHGATAPAWVSQLATAVTNLTTEGAATS